MSDILSIGARTLQNYQTALSVTSSNISNEAVEGYARRTLDFNNTWGVQEGRVEVGQGANIDSVVRNFNSYLSKQSLTQNGEASASKTEYDALSNVEADFIDDEDYGTSALLSKFWTSWSDLTQDPEDESARSALLGQAQTLVERFNFTKANLQTEADSMELEASDEIDKINELLKQVAGLNTKLAAANGDTSLLDERDRLLGELSEDVGVDVTYHGDGQVSVRTTSGLSLVEGDSCNSLAWEEPQARSHLSSASTFNDAIYFEGSSAYEYTLEVTSDGPADASGAAAEFKVSLDGGKTWLTNDDGTVKTFTAGDKGSSVRIGEVTIWFGTEADSSATATTDLTTGDRFTVVPKSSAYLVTSTSHASIAPLAGSGDGSGGNRVTGGKLAGILSARDSTLEYAEELDGVAGSLIWEVNRLHSQGSGLESMSVCEGAYSTSRITVALADSGLTFASDLSEGSLSVALYDSVTGTAQGVTVVDFTSTTGQANFDPATDTLEDVRDAINATFAGGEIVATIENGSLKLDADPAVTFQFADDSTGLLAALGLNTFFTGSDASTIEINTTVSSDLDRICAGSVSGVGEATDGDNSTARAIAGLADKTVKMYSITSGTTFSTIGERYSALVSKVGSDTASAESDYEYASALAANLTTQIESVSGVNTDEELTQLTRFQYGYQAASKIIQASVKMFDVLMSLG